MISRRSFFIGLAGIIAAPAIVRAGSLMPVKSMPAINDLEQLLRDRIDGAYLAMADAITEYLYGDKGYPVRRMIDIQDSISFPYKITARIAQR